MVGAVGVFPAHELLLQYGLKVVFHEIHTVFKRPKFHHLFNAQFFVCNDPYKLNYIVITGGLTEIKSFKNLVYEILGKDVIIYSMDIIGVRNNKYTTAFGMLKAFAEKMKIRGKEYTMITKDDEELLLTPEDKKRKDKVGVSKIIKGFIKNKEEKYE